MLLTRVTSEPKTFLDVLTGLLNNPNVDWGIVWFMISVYLIMFGLSSWVINGILRQINKVED